MTMRTIASLNERMWYRFVKVCYFLAYFLVSIVITVMVWSVYEEDFKVFSSSQIEDITSVVHNLTGFTGSSANIITIRESSSGEAKKHIIELSKDEAKKLLGKEMEQQSWQPHLPRTMTKEEKEKIQSILGTFINSDKHSHDYYSLRFSILYPIGHEDYSRYYDRMVADGVWKSVGSYEPESFDFETIGKFFGMLLIALFVQFLVFEVIRRVFYYIVLGNFYPNS